MNVLIVESPAKAKTINKYLGSNFKVLASYGHIRDLPSKDGSVDPDNDFAMIWATDAAANKRIREMADAVKGCDKLYLATDPDREGEAIAWHVMEVLAKRRVLKGVEVKRVVFNQITKSAILKAVAEPRDLDQEMVNAYLARRALDYLVGFTLSPVLWRKLPGARSAGRVQSVALRLVVDREREVEMFKTTEYWSVTAGLKTPGGDTFAARLTHVDGKKLTKHGLGDEAAALSAVAATGTGDMTITALDTKPQKRHPKPPFTTSTLQQEAARKLGFSASHTMRVAQGLYEGRNIDGETTGLITYMRTDGVTMAQEAIHACRAVIGETYGDRFVPAKPKFYANKSKNAQEAHEAIRPTNAGRRPSSVAKNLNEDERRLYDLIWKRALSSQMESAVLERTTADIDADGGRAIYRATGTVVQFEGFLKLYQESRDDGEDDDDRRLPRMNLADTLSVDKIAPEQHFTEPPPRYSEASLVRKLEELGIGRPSTYASILSVLRDRSYVIMERKRFIPEDKGRVVTAFLEAFFTRYVEFDFTAKLERQLDEISEGRLEWKKVLEEFWADFHPKTVEMLELKGSEVMEAIDAFMAPHIFPAKEDGSDPRECPSCDDGRLSLKRGKYGAFVGCSNYPDCKHTRQMNETGDAGADGETGDRTLGSDPETGHAIQIKKGRFGPYIQLGDPVDGEKPPRASIPKDVDPASVELELALKLLSLPREVGMHPESGKPITAAIGRYGPYVAHERTFANLASSEEVFTVGLNRAVTLIEEKKKNGGRRPGPKELKDLGEHPDGGSIKLLEGRYGPYVKHEKINATIPKGTDPGSVTLEQAIEMIKEKAAKGPTKKRRSKKAS